jgi:putative peptide zinc metalloprotease protein
MAGYTPESLVTIRPYTHRFEGDTVILGDIDRHIFLAIPAEGLDILQSLAAGNSVGAAARAYEEKYQEAPDIVDFLEALEQEGFIGEASAVAAGEVADVRQAHWRWRMEWLSPRTAQRLVSWPVLAACGVLIAVGVALMVDDPSVLPMGGNAWLFPIDFAALTWATIILSMFGVFLHELGHVVAARAAGVSAGMGVGNQLWILVAQTDMTGIWLAPKRQRYVAFAIGAIIDAVSSAFLAAFIWSVHRGWFNPPRWTVLLATALLLTSLARIIWQFFFYLRTDGYYIIATALNCKNLMADTDDYLRNLWARLRRSPRRIDQSGIPAREMRVIRRFSLLWFFGRIISFVLYAIIILPVLWGYTYQFILLLTGNETQFNSFDFVTVGIIVFALDGGGLTMWLRGLYRSARARRRQHRSPHADKSKPAPESAPEPAGIA